jgi:hypothetical protein
MITALIISLGVVAIRAAIARRRAKGPDGADNQ